MKEDILHKDKYEEYEWISWLKHARNVTETLLQKDIKTAWGFMCQKNSRWDAALIKTEYEDH